MNSNQARFLALSCVGFLTSATATAQRYGQPSEDEANDKDVVVEGQREQQVALPKQVAPLVNTPRSIVVVPKEVIEQTGSTSLQEALRTVPGITFGAAEGGNPIGDRPFIRGFDSQGSTYVDGVRDFAAQTREVFAVESIQVVRGSDSTLGGRGSAGGTINIVSKMPVARDFIAADASYGTDDYKRFTLDVNRKLSDTVAVRVEGLYHDQDVAGRDAVHQRRWGVAPTLTIGLGTPTRLIAQYYHLENHDLPDSGIPYLYTIGNAPLGTNLSEPAVRRVTTISGPYERAASGGDFRGCFNHARMLVLEGRTEQAVTWIERAVELGNPRFREQVRAWLAGHEDLELRHAGLAAPDRC